MFFTDSAGGELMGRLAYNGDPVDIEWPIVRGDDEEMPLTFANPGGFTVTSLGNGAEDVDVTDPLPISGRVYTATVVATRGGTTVLEPTVTVDDADAGEITVSLTKAQTAQLTGPRYTWVLREDDVTLVIGRMPVTSGKATS